MSGGTLILLEILLVSRPGVRLRHLATGLAQARSAEKDAREAADKEKDP